MNFLLYNFLPISDSGLCVIRILCPARGCTFPHGTQWALRLIINYACQLGIFGFLCPEISMQDEQPLSWQRWLTLHQEEVGLFFLFVCFFLHDGDREEYVWSPGDSLGFSRCFFAYSWLRMDMANHPSLGRAWWVDPWGVGSGSCHQVSHRPAGAVRQLWGLPQLHSCLG